MTQRSDPSPADSVSPSPSGVLRRSLRFRITGLATSALGIALLVYLVRRTGVAPILEGAREVGWGFLGIVALGGLRFAARAVAWGRSIEAPWRLTFPAAFAATLSGDALGNVTPLSVIVSEPAKVAFVRPVVPLGPAASALAIENFLYSLTVAVVIALGMIAMLLAFDLTEPLRTISAVSLATMLGLLVAAIWMIGRRLAVVSPVLDRLAGGRAVRWIARVRLLEARTFELYERRRGRLVPVLALEAVFHAAGVAEVYLTLWLLTGTAPTLLIAFLLESVNRVITVVFKFVPLRVGVDEAGTALFTNVLGLGTATGVTLALVRKARVIVWVLVGLALLVRRGLTVKGILADAELTARG